MEQIPTTPTPDKSPEQQFEFPEHIQQLWDRLEKLDADINNLNTDLDYKTRELKDKAPQAGAVLSTRRLRPSADELSSVSPHFENPESSDPEADQYHINRVQDMVVNINETNNLLKAKYLEREKIQNDFEIAVLQDICSEETEMPTKLAQYQAMQRTYSAQYRYLEIQNDPPTLDTHDPKDGFFTSADEEIKRLKREYPDIVKDATIEQTLQRANRFQFLSEHSFRLTLDSIKGKIDELKRRLSNT